MLAEGLLTLFLRTNFPSSQKLNFFFFSFFQYDTLNFFSAIVLDVVVNDSKANALETCRKLKQKKLGLCFRFNLLQNR